MEPMTLGFFARLALALRVLFDGLLAGRVQSALSAPAAPSPQLAPQRVEATPAGPKAAPAATPSTPGAEPTEGKEGLPEIEAEALPVEPAEDEASAEPVAALQLWSLLQREGRLIDFLQENVTGFSDEEVGAAARVVHEGCQRVLTTYFTLAPVRSEDEGDAVVLEAGFDAGRHRLTGQVGGTPPYRGQLAHAGWEMTSCRLPALNADHDPRIVAPAEVEL